MEVLELLNLILMVNNEMKMKNCFGDFIHLQIERKIYYLLLLARRFVPGPVLVLLPAIIDYCTLLKRSEY